MEEETRNDHLRFRGGVGLGSWFRVYVFGLQGGFAV